MAEPLVDIFKNIADSIRFKEGSDKKLKPEYFYANIMNLSEINTDDGTATETDILEGKIAYSQGQRIVGTLEKGVPQNTYDQLLIERNNLQSQVNTLTSEVEELTTLSTNLQSQVTNLEAEVQDAHTLADTIIGEEMWTDE